MEQRVDDALLWQTCAGCEEWLPDDGHCPTCEPSHKPKEMVKVAADLAYALRLAVITEFPKERFDALEAWEAFVLKHDRKHGYP
jgi:hypothetical protein